MAEEQSTGSESLAPSSGTTPCSELLVPQVVIAEIIDAPCLHGITTRDFVAFKDKREIYERRLAGNNPDPQVQVRLASYRDCIPSHLINALVHMGMVDATRVEDVTEEDLKNCVARQATVDNTERALATVEEEIAHLTMEDPSICGSLTESVLNLCIRYFAILGRCGCDSLVAIAPDTAIDHILTRIIPETFKSRVFRIVRIRQVDGIKKSFKSFFQELVAEARRFEAQS